MSAREAPAPTGVSFVLPVYDGERLLPAVLDAILAQDDGRPFELIAVDDGSRDGSLRILQRYAAADSRVRVLAGSGRGAAAALNLGFRAALHPIVCQVDQDVVPRPGWMAALLAALADPRVAAAQGWYETPASGSFWARAMGLDLELRYSRLRGDRIDHVCSGNTAYRVAALRQVGWLDESLGYGYDNDVSYRLGGAGWQLAFCREARAVHHWRAGLLGYLRQQYGVGYGRLDLVAKHPARAGGDAVSGLRMIVHAPAMLVALLAAGAALVAAAAGVPWVPPAALAAALVGVLALDRLAAGIEAAVRFRTLGGLAFVPAHLVRDVAWAAALVVWTLRRLAGKATTPGDSMARGIIPAATAVAGDVVGVVAIGEVNAATSGHSQGAPAFAGARLRTPEDFLVLVPARNEAANLPALLAELRATCPQRAVLVVDDASTDETAQIAARAGLPCLRLRAHLGVGGALRAGLRWASRHGYQTLVRVDGDGQHPPAAIAALVAPIAEGTADAAQGTRSFTAGAAGGYRPALWVRLGQRLLARLLGGLAGRRVTDPTSGFWAFGPAAVRLLGEHHPTGYPEPELLLFLHRNRLRVAAVPVAMRRRAAGRSSLTVPRLAHAGWRVFLALLVVPLRGRVVAAAPR